MQPNPDNFGLLVTMYIEWRRLKGYPAPPQTPIDAMIDGSAGIGMDDPKILSEFAAFFREVVIDRCQLTQQS